MTFNQFMHPRNIYRQKPNYEEMSKTYPEFAQQLSYDYKQKPYIDYSDIDALRCLTRTLLKKDFNLDVEIPRERLVPTLPLRLNYILWIEDLIQHCRIGDKVVGIDIGTGSCAIFPLLATTLNPEWNFIASEIDEINLKFANINVQKNNLSNRIKVLKNDSEIVFKHYLAEYSDVKINFLMTNPPFFEDTFNDSFEDSERKSNTFHSKKTNTAGSNEAICDGGELNFIKKIINESFETKTAIDIYTVLIGRKQSFLELKSMFKEYLKNSRIGSFTCTELCQGNTKRWSIAWTFNSQFNISNAPKIIHSKSKPLIHYLKPTIQVCEYDLSSVAEYIKKILLNDLDIEDFSVIETRKRIEFDIKSNEAKWKNQRKKRREQKFKEQLEQQSTELSLNNDVGLKRKQSNETLKSNQSTNKKHKETKELCKVDLTFLLHCGIILKRDKQTIYLKMFTKEMSQNKENTFQFFQYFKNKFN